MASCAPFRRPKDSRQCSPSSARKVDKFLLFDVADDELVKRLSGRTVCENCQTPYKGLEPGTKCEKCGGKLVRRKDDEPEAIRNRLEVYRSADRAGDRLDEGEEDGRSSRSTRLVMSTR